MRCPICGKPVRPPPPDSPGSIPDAAIPPDAAQTPDVFPFCSDRCRLIDLGRWLDGKYHLELGDVPKDVDAGPIRPPKTDE